MPLETLFPVKKQATRIYTRNKVSGVSVFPNWSLGTRPHPSRSQTPFWERDDPGNSVSSKKTSQSHLYTKQSFGCQCVPKPEFGNKASKFRLSLCSQTGVWEQDLTQLFPKLEFGNKEKGLCVPSRKSCYP